MSLGKEELVYILTPERMEAEDRFDMLTFRSSPLNDGSTIAMSPYTGTLDLNPALFPLSPTVHRDDDTDNTWLDSPIDVVEVVEVQTAKRQKTEESMGMADMYNDALKLVKAKMELAAKCKKYQDGIDANSRRLSRCANRLPFQGVAISSGGGAVVSETILGRMESIATLKKHIAVHCGRTVGSSDTNPMMQAVTQEMADLNHEWQGWVNSLTVVASQQEEIEI